MKDNLSPDVITAEKSLWQVFIVSTDLPRDRFAFGATVVFFLVLTVCTLFGYKSPLQIQADLLLWAGNGFLFGVGGLIFVVTGILLTASSSESLLIAFSQVKHKKSGHSYLKYNLVTLMYAAIVYLTLAVMSFFIYVFGGFTVVISKLIYLGLLTLIFYSLMVLKTYIFNIYAVIMARVRFAVELQLDSSENN